MTKDWRPFAQYILDTIDKIRRIQARGRVVNDDILYDAALRNLQTLSEATQSLSEDLKAHYAGIPWQEISGFRNILVHNYLGDIDPETVEAVIEKQLDPLGRAVESMLAK